MSIIPFTNRLRKNIRHFGRWARRQELEAYRLYDADLDEFPCTIDRYATRYYVAIFDNKGPENWRQKSAPDQQSSILQALTDALTAVPKQEVPDPDFVHFKVRKRQRGEQQYRRLSQVEDFFTIRENQLQFYVNLSDYLDTGLFLDHRQSRAMIRELAKGKSVLNLFAYTCSFSVYAAAGGATTTLSLDLSGKYLDWGRRNMELNELMSPHHRFEQTDVLAWLAENSKEKFDLIVLDPPTFSNSKSMTTTLDVQRDHTDLIEKCMNKLHPNGTLFFSTNHRGFRLAEEDLTTYRIKEITQQTLPPDFRKGQIHRAWLLKTK
ncbi:MAG: class I SAM-dependent methyltransferase [Bacteroidota bacterium]